MSRGGRDGASSAKAWAERKWGHTKSNERFCVKAGRTTNCQGSGFGQQSEKPSLRHFGLSGLRKLELDGLGQVKLCEHPGTVEIAFATTGVLHCNTARDEIDHDLEASDLDGGDPQTSVRAPGGLRGFWSCLLPLSC